MENGGGKLGRIEEELNALFFEREEEVRGLLVGLLAREHVLLLGPPGAAKSELAEELCSRMVGGGSGEGDDTGYFRWLLTRTSTPEELFGPISVKALEEDSYRRKTGGKLPEARVAFLDEIFRCNSAVLNGLLSVLNERLFFNDGEPERIPLQMVVGASNELPADREELEAVWDRFLLRYEVSYLKEEKSFEAMLLRGVRGAAKERSTLTADELARAQEGAEGVDVSGPVLAEVAALRRELSSEEKISVSDRRYARSLSLLKANAYLEGRGSADIEDLALLRHVLWQEPDQRREVAKKVMDRANPQLQAVQDLFDEAREIHQKALAAPGETATNEGQEANAKLKGITGRLLDLRNEVERSGRSTRRIDDVLERVSEMNREVIHRCLGIKV